MSATNLDPNEQNIWKIVNAIRQLIQGRNNATGMVTLTPGTTTTTVLAPNCAAGSCVVLFAATASAATATTASVDSPYVLQANVSNGQFIISHTNLASVDRTFYWVVLG